jgi:sulfide dehydrogenase [flavocytochrome c] flavoprotein subunit
MPKSGYSANSEAKICAMNIVNALMNGKETTDMSGINTCYSYITDKEAVSVAAVYRGQGRQDHCRPRTPVAFRRRTFRRPRSEAIYAESWLKNILTEMST